MEHLAGNEKWGRMKIKNAKIDIANWEPGPPETGRETTPGLN
jgi:hypothetical protein